MITKGILLAGGSGTRLYPITGALSKQHLPIYDKPMIYYPLSVMLDSGISDIAVVCRSEHKSSFERMLSFSHMSVKFTFIIQDEPLGIAHAFKVCKDFIGSSSVMLVLGDNLFHGITGKSLKNYIKLEKGALIFGKKVKNPQDYGVALFEGSSVIKIIEKPSDKISDVAIPGLYFYDNTVVQKVESLKPSSRGELEITDLNNLYIKENSLSIEMLGDDVAWFDTGTFDSLFEASMYIKAVQSRTGNMIGVPEECAYRSKIMSRKQLMDFTTSNQNQYCKYLLEKYSKQ